MKNYWQPIDTIPKDGTHVLVTNMTVKTCPCTVAHWFEYLDDKTKSGLFLSWNANDEDSDYQMDTVTHWMPIPTLQTLQAERQRCEEMVEAERERIKTEVMIVYEQWRDEVEDKRFDTENIGMFALGYRLRCCFEIEKSTTVALTQPQ